MRICGPSNKSFKTIEAIHAILVALQIRVQNEIVTTSAPTPTVNATPPDCCDAHCPVQ